MQQRSLRTCPPPTHVQLLIASCFAFVAAVSHELLRCSKGKNAAEVADDAGHLDISRMLREAAEV